MGEKLSTQKPIINIFQGKVSKDSPPPQAHCLPLASTREPHNYQIRFPISDSCQYFSYFYPYIYAVDPILTSHSSQGTYGNTSIRVQILCQSGFHNKVKLNLHDPLYSCFQTYFILRFQYSSLLTTMTEDFLKFRNFFRICRNLSCFVFYVYAFAYIR
jgi:hypothetical protein